MARHLDRLKELTEISRLAGSLGDGSGRYARTPDYTRPSSTSSRPKSDRGSTFHFAHKAMSKGNDMSDSNRTHTTSGAHQGYIERPSATEEIDPGVVAMIKRYPSPDIEDELIAPGFLYPDRVVDPYRASFGTLGKTKSDRKEFWNDVERNEAKRARVQSRIIAELPVELTVEERCAAALDFCQAFEERGLPYWATIHSPGKRNDKRNFHLHITYFERPSGTNSQGEWAHCKTEKRTKKSRNTYVVRPHRSNRHPATRKRSWVKELRAEYADACNFYLSGAMHDKRYDPRSYRDSGIEKEPTEHLGNKLSAIEAMGIDTRPGERNSKREIRWIIQQAEEPWVERARALRASPAFAVDALAERREELVRFAETGITAARKSASMNIVSQFLTLRAEQRDAFLMQEIDRLSNKDDLSDFAVRTGRIIALSSEREALADRLPELEITAKKCRTIGGDHMKTSLILLKRFDRGMSLFDPDKVLKDDGAEKLDRIDEFAPEKDHIDQLSPREMQSINDLFGEDPALAKSLADKKSEDQKALKAGASRPATKADPDVSDIGPAPENTDDKAVEAKPLDPELTILDVIRRATSSDDAKAGGYLADPESESAADAFPDAWSVRPSQGQTDIVTLDKKLAALDNKSLRLAAIATRDASDLCAAGKPRQDFNRGWEVLRFEAARRGLDLDTGKHTPELATDPERALLHVDEDLCSIRVIRKNIARQRVRT